MNQYRITEERGFFSISTNEDDAWWTLDIYGELCALSKRPVHFYETLNDALTSIARFKLPTKYYNEEGNPI